jgi:hypothetical protein
MSGDQIAAFFHAHPWMARTALGGAVVLIITFVKGFIEGWRER